MDSVVVELASSGDRIRQRVGWVKWIVSGKLSSVSHTHTHTHTSTYPLMLHFSIFPHTLPHTLPHTHPGHGDTMEPPFTPPTPLTPPTPVTPVTYIPTGWERGGTSEYYVSMVTSAPAWEWGGRGMDEMSVASSTTSEMSEGIQVRGLYL